MHKLTAIFLTGMLTPALTTFTALSEEGDQPGQNPDAEEGERPEQPDQAGRRKPRPPFQRDGEDDARRPQPRPRDGEPFVGGPRPTEEEMEERRIKMNARQLELVNNIIKKFDEDGDGKLGSEELGRAIEMARAIGVLGKKMPQENGAPPPWKPFDANQDGQLDEGERVHAKEGFQHRRRQQGGPDTDAMPKKFDADGDGKLNEEEEVQAQKEMKKRKGRGPGPNPERLLEKFDADGDGKLNEEEQGRADEVMRKHHEKMLERFDADGDGELNEEEREKAMQEREGRGAQEGPKRGFKRNREGEGAQTGGEGERLDF